VKRLTLACSIASFLVLGLHVNGWTQSWPAKPIRAVIPFAAGSFTDVAPRVVFERLGTRLGQPIIVENRGGAGSTIGAAAVAKAEPDGYTMLATSSAHVIVPSMYSNIPYDTARDFAAVASLGQTPLVMVIAPSKGITTLRDYVTHAKANPSAVNFASAGVGSATHLGAERFRIAAGFTAVHIPFRGGSEAMTEVISGRSDFYFCPIGTALPHLREGRLLALAVSSPQRTSALPDVPSVLESFPDSDYSFWVGVFLPVQTPRDIVDRLHHEIDATLKDPTVRERTTTLGMEPMPLTPAEFDALVRKDIISSAALAKAAGMKPD
jgi:tripartite-type tricarboxylate transporter receptor subunit TctC